MKKILSTIAFIPLLLLASTWTSKVIGISDGDTIKVLKTENKSKSVLTV